MATSIKNIAIGLGCVTIVAFVVARLSTDKGAEGYQPITSLSHLASTTGQEASPPASVEVSEPQISFEYEQPAPMVEQLVPPAALASSFVEPEDEIVFADIELLEIPDQNPQPADLEFTQEPYGEISAPPQLDLPPTDAATEQVVHQVIPTAEVEVEAPQRQSLGKAWKQNPFMSGDSTPIPSPVSKVQPASMAVAAQAVRSLNDPRSIPNGGRPEVQPDALTASRPLARRNFTPTRIQLSEAAAQKAAHHIEYGKSLARRGASFAARHEFFSALRVVAEANDISVNGNEFSMALSKAIRAMKEAEDFNVSDAQSFAVVDVPATIEAHKTRLFTSVEARRITPLSAMQQYYKYAGEQLDYAGGRNVVTAEALHCLGKLHSGISRQRPANSNNFDIAQAIVFHKASLLSNANNPASANELGVLMAKSGNLKEATDLFKRSLVSQATPQAWSNLAKTHHRLGEQDMAQLAKAEIAPAAQTTSIATAAIQWVDTPRFKAMAPLEFEPRVAQKAPPVALPKTESQQNNKEKPEASIAQRIKNWF